MLDSTTFSAGYGNKKINDFISLLHQYTITTVVDIRSNPFSRFQPAYNKAKFQAILFEYGITYIFKGDCLGGKPSNEMLYTDGKLNYSLVKSTKEYQSGITNLIELVMAGEKICLVCCELNPDHCHRKTLVAESLVKRGIAVSHISAKGEIDVHKNNSPLSFLF